VIEAYGSDLNDTMLHRQFAEITRSRTTSALSMAVPQIVIDRIPDGIFGRLAREPNQINSDFVGLSCSRSEENNAADH